MQYLQYAGFSVIVKRALFLEGFEEGATPLVFAEIAGFESSVKAVSAALLGNKSVTLIEGEKTAIEVKLARSCLDSYLDSYHRKIFSNKLFAHCILYPEIALKRAWDSSETRVLIGFSEEELKEKLRRYMSQYSSVPLFDEGLDKLFDFIKQEAIDGATWLKGFGGVYGIVISPQKFDCSLVEFTSSLIKEKRLLKGLPVEIRNLDDLLSEFGESLEQTLVARYKPLYEVGQKYPELAEAERKLEEIYRASGKKKIPAQKEVILAAAKAFQSGRKRLVLCGEQGTGKTFMTLGLIGTLPPQRVLIVCPPHLVKKWAREAKETLPQARVFTLNGKGALSSLQMLLDAPGKPLVHEVWVIGRERLKLSCGWEPALMWKKCYPRYGKGFKNIPVCPDCGRFQVHKDILLTKLSDFRKKKRRCCCCGAPLWQPAEPRRWSPAEFIRRKLRGKFGLLVVDECHEYKAKCSAQGGY